MAVFLKAMQNYCVIWPNASLRDKNIPISGVYRGSVLSVNNMGPIYSQRQIS